MIWGAQPSPISDSYTPSTFTGSPLGQVLSLKPLAESPWVSYHDLLVVMREAKIQYFKLLAGKWKH